MAVAFVHADQIAGQFLGTLLEQRPPVDLSDPKKANAKSADGDALFLRSAGAVPFPTGHAEAVRTVHAIQDAFAQRHGKALPVAIELVPDASRLPMAVGAAAAHRRVDSLGQGVCFNNTVYVIENDHSTAEGIERTVFHELYGHAATRVLFGGQWSEAQNALFKAEGGYDGLLRLGKANGTAVTAYAAALKADRTWNEADRRAILMDQVMAHSVEKKSLFRQRIKAVIGAVRAWLREHSFMRLAEYGDTDLVHLRLVAVRQV